MYIEYISQATRVVVSLFMGPSEMESVTRDKYQISILKCFSSHLVVVFTQSVDCRQAMLQLHLSHQQFNCLLKCALYKRLDGSNEKLPHLKCNNRRAHFDISKAQRMWWWFWRLIFRRLGLENLKHNFCTPYQITADATGLHVHLCQLNRRYTAIFSILVGALFLYLIFETLYPQFLSDHEWCDKPTRSQSSIT